MYIRREDDRQCMYYLYLCIFAGRTMDSVYVLFIFMYICREDDGQCLCIIISPNDVFGDIMVLASLPHPRPPCPRPPRRR